MNKKEIKQHLYQAVAAQTPDIYEEVANIPVQRVKPSAGPAGYEKRKKKAYYIPAAALIAACLCLLIAGEWLKNGKIMTIIDIDVNPSIELQVNHRDRVVKVIALNEDAERVLAGMDLRKTDIEVASNAILGSMVKLGYINETNNAILITVESKEAKRAEELKEKITADVNQVLKDHSLNAIVLNQDAADMDVDDLAETYGISKGKAVLIYQMAQKDPALEIADLALLSIGELTAMANTSQNMTLEDLVTDKSEYIGEEKAKEIALAETEGGLVQEIELEYEESQVVYEIEIINGNKEYKISVHAGTGEVLSIETEDTEEEDESDREDKDDDGDKEDAEEEDEEEEKQNRKQDVPADKPAVKKETVKPDKKKETKQKVSQKDNKQPEDEDADEDDDIDDDEEDEIDEDDEIEKKALIQEKEQKKNNKEEDGEEAGDDEENEEEFIEDEESEEEAGVEKESEEEAGDDEESGEDEGEDNEEEED